MTKKDYITHIIKNIIHTTNVTNELETNNEKDNRVGAFNTVSQIARNFVTHKKSYRTKNDYDGNSKCNIKLKENSSSNILGEAHIDCTWSIEKFTNTLNSMKEKKKIVLDSKVEDSLTLNTKESQNLSGFDCKPFITTFNSMKMKWNVSVRFLTGDDGEQVLNPVAICLNLLPSADDIDDLIHKFLISYQFGIYNYITNKFEKVEEISTTDCQITKTNCQKIKNIGFKIMKITNRHINSKGGIKIACNTSLTYTGNSLPLSNYLNNYTCHNSKPDLVIETVDCKQYHVHKQMLWNQSSFFDEILTKSICSHECSTEVDLNDNIIKNNLEHLKVVDIRSDVLEEVLYFIYTKSLCNANQFAKTLIEIADNYKLIDLKLCCENHVTEGLTTQNLSEILYIANKYKCQHLKKSSLLYCKTHCDQIFKDEGWKRLEDQEPELYEEAVRTVIGDEYSLCDKHIECLEKNKSSTRLSLHHRKAGTRNKLPFRKKNLIS